MAAPLSAVGSSSLTGSGSASAPVLLFCVGATKAGTSWLHNYLSGHPETYFRYIKELHFWDKEGETSRAPFIKMLARQRRMAQIQRKQAQSPKVRANQLRRIDDLDDLTALHENPDEARYLAYMAKGAGEARLIGDITPAYSLCSEAVIARMQAMSPNSRFIYVMRDPVGRLWSHVRMMAQRRADLDSEIPERTQRIFERVLAGQEPEIASRSDYAGALGRLNAALDPSRLLVLFYEDLFSQETIDRVCQFLSLSPHEADVEHKVLASASVQMNDAQRGRAALYLAPQYSAVAHHMGALPAAWDRHMGMIV